MLGVLKDFVAYRVTPPTSSMSSTAFANIMQHHQQQQQQKPVFNNPPDVLVNAAQNPGDKMAATNMATCTDGHNITMATTVTSISGGGKGKITYFSHFVILGLNEIWAFTDV